MGTVCISDAEIEIVVQALQELRIHKELRLAEAFLDGAGRVVAQPPKVIRVIAIGGLETGNLVLIRKKDG